MLKITRLFNILASKKLKLIIKLLDLILVIIKKLLKN